jgi:hypothetical protein
VWPQLWQQLPEELRAMLTFSPSFHRWVVSFWAVNRRNILTRKYAYVYIYTHKYLCVCYTFWLKHRGVNSESRFPDPQLRNPQRSPLQVLLTHQKKLYYRTTPKLGIF